MLLAIDATGPWLALGLYGDAGVAGAPRRRLVERPRGQAEILFDELAGLLDEARADLSRIRRIAAARGPGSFTGIRVTLAAAQGLALALERPLVGIDTLEAMAEAVRDRSSDMPLPETFAVAVKMGRGRLVAHRFRSQGSDDFPLREGDPLWLTADETGSRALGGVPLAVPMELEGPVVEAARWRIPLAARLDALARLGAGRAPAQAPARPLYLKRPRIGPAGG